MNNYRSTVCECLRTTYKRGFSKEFKSNGVYAILIFDQRSKFTLSCGRKCSYADCDNSYRKHPGISFHKFPTTNPALCAGRKTGNFRQKLLLSGLVMKKWINLVPINSKLISLTCCVIRIHVWVLETVKSIDGKTVVTSVRLSVNNDKP